MFKVFQNKKQKLKVENGGGGGNCPKAWLRESAGMTEMNSNVHEEHTIMLMTFPEKDEKETGAEINNCDLKYKTASERS